MKYIQEAFDGNWVAPLGPNVNGFEQDIENFLGGNIHVAALSSGTAALHLSLILLGVKPGDNIICQSMTFSASANPIVYLGANPVFIDSELDTWNLCPIAVEKAIINCISDGKKPKAIITVSLYGMPYKSDEITEISRKYDIPIIEDSAEALGSSYKGKKCGTLGDISVISFNGNKIITTSGGGALIVQNKDYKDKTVFLSTQAKDEAPHYEHSQIGYNYRMSNICAGIGRGQMEVLVSRIERRRENHKFYKTLFKDINGIKVLEEPNEDFYSNHWLSAITIDPVQWKFTREDLRLHLMKSNIESRPLWKPLHTQPIFKKYKFFGDNNSESLFECGLCLPSGSNMSENDLQRISESIKSFFTFAK